MSFKEHDPVVLVQDFEGQGLRTGDLGTVVYVYSPDSVEVEFVAASGRTRALVTLASTALRAASDFDQVSVRHDPQAAL